MGGIFDFAIDLFDDLGVHYFTGKNVIRLTLPGATVKYVKDNIDCRLDQGLSIVKDFNTHPLCLLLIPESDRLIVGNGEGETLKLEGFKK